MPESPTKRTVCGVAPSWVSARCNGAASGLGCSASPRPTITSKKPVSAALSSSVRGGDCRRGGGQGGPGGLLRCGRRPGRCRASQADDHIEEAGECCLVQQRACRVLIAVRADPQGDALRTKHRQKLE